MTNDNRRETEIDKVIGEMCNAECYMPYTEDITKVYLRRLYDAGAADSLKRYEAAGVYVSHALMEDFTRNAKALAEVRKRCELAKSRSAIFVYNKAQMDMADNILAILAKLEGGEQELISDTSGSGQPATPNRIEGDSDE